MDAIPTDQETKQKIVDIINHQFDLEIYLKQREVATIRNEITKAEHALQDLKLAVEHESMAASMPESAHYTRRSAMYFQGGSQALLQQPTSSIVPRRKTYRTSEKSKLYGRRNDGVFVSLACPVCFRDDLLNLQGFLNHCRISHNLEFGPYEQVMLQCGTPVDESEVPMDNPARLRPVMNLTPSASKPQKKLERPSIKVFEEDVDMELENERKSSQHKAAEAEAARDQEAMVAESSTRSSSVENTPAVDASTQLQQNATDKEAMADTLQKSEEDMPVPLEAAPLKEAAPSQEAAPLEVPLKEAAPLKGEASSQEVTPSQAAAPSQAAVDTSASNTDKEMETKPLKSQEAPPPPAKIESFAAAMSSGTTSDVGSRFYIKRRILVGNVSKFISPERRDPALKQFTHKWMIYVVEPPQSKQPVGAFITCVRFHLHPSYKPNDVVDVTEPPFKLTRFGWGEFPIRIQLFFVDKKRNKAVDLIHHLKLDNSHSGKQLLGGERSIEIELDRNTDFKDTTLSPVPTPTPSAPQTPLHSTTTATTVQKEQDSSSTTLLPIAVPPQEIEQKQQQEIRFAMAVKQKMSLLHGILKESVRRLPIVRAGSHGTVLPYSCATSCKQFFEWSIGKRKAQEWHRARLLRLETQKRALESNEHVLRVAAEALTTKDVVLWCRSNKYTPIQSDTTEDVCISDLAPGYCKFCGSVRDGHDATVDDHCPRRPKGWNSRKRGGGGINSTTSVSRLLSTLEAGWDHVPSEKEDMDVDMDDDEEERAPQPQDATLLLQRIRQACALDEESMDVAHERSLDWVWSVVGQLRLKSVIANDMLLAKDGNLQGPTAGFDLAAAMKQRLVVGNMMAQATRVFLKKLVQETVSTCRREEEGSADKSTKMMVPYHVYQAAQHKQEFDFLTNQYMGPEQ